jgi:hypothetical protein
MYDKQRKKEEVIYDSREEKRALSSGKISFLLTRRDQIICILL